jgi:hypothetical protein
VVDRDETGVGDRSVVREGVEIGLPDPRGLRALVDEVHDRAADTADGRDGELVWTAPLLEELRPERGCTREGRRGVLHPQADVAGPDAVGEGKPSGRSLRAPC